MTTLMDPDRRKTIHDAIVRLSDGDRSAFPVLLEGLWPPIVALARRGIPRGADAEDIAQEVFLRICYRIADFDRTRDGVSWAFGIAGYEIMTHRKRMRRRREIGTSSDLPAIADSAASQEDALLQRELAASLAQLLEELSAQERETLGLGGPERDAQVGGATMRKRRQRALDRLRALWRSLHGDT